MRDQAANGIDERELFYGRNRFDKIKIQALRLADEQDLYNQEAARKMGISRQTFDRIIRAARHKVATALVHGNALRIQPRC